MEDERLVMQIQLPDRFVYFRAEEGETIQLTFLRDIMLAGRSSITQISLHHMFICLLVNMRLFGYITDGCAANGLSPLRLLRSEIVPEEMIFLRFTLVLLSLASISLGWPTFEVPHVQEMDDTPGLLSIITNHSANATILFKRGVSYNIFSPIKFPVLNNVEIRIEGNLSYPSDIPTVQGEYSLLELEDVDSFFLLAFVDSDVGSANAYQLEKYINYVSTGLRWILVYFQWRNKCHSAWFNGSGMGMGGCPWSGGLSIINSQPLLAPYILVSQWWDANQQTNRPHGWAFSKINGGVIRDMKLWKASEGDS